MGQNAPTEELVSPDARTEEADGKPIVVDKAREEEVARQTAISLQLAQADAARHLGGLMKNIRS